MRKTVNDAAKKLPENARGAFLRAWARVNEKDIYDGDLRSYLNVIAKHLETRDKKIIELKGCIIQARQSLQYAMDLG